MRPNVHIVLLGIGLVLLGGNTLAESPGEGVKVQPGRATWTTGFFLEALYGQALEDLGYKVEKAKSLAAPIFYQALILGDVDYWANGWFPLHRTQLPARFEEKGEIAGYAVEKGALQGYLVSRQEVEKYDITSLEDFKREEVKKAFDANGDGKADLTACPPGWGCEKVISHHLDVYELRD
ncbi:MAG: glycine betaine ABC transporter substrate-binding protein, partial [Thermodesulfobacteriota bacterium]